MTSQAFSQQRYSFPHISFSEGVVGPIPFSPSWRNRVGIAGVFSRGPEGPTLIDNRRDFAYLFGEDDSPGALFVRQAMLQGASSFTISRVMPSAKKSAGAIFLSASSPLASEAVVASGADRTTGLSLEFNYIGTPLYERGEYVGDSVTCKSGTLGLTEAEGADFKGVGYFDFKVVELVDTTFTAVEAITVNINNEAETDHVQLITASAADGVALQGAAKPGRVVKVNTGGAGTYSDGNSAQLKILSYAFEVSSGTYGCYVQGSVSGTSSTDVIDIDTNSGSDPDYYVVSVAYRSGDASSLPPEIITSKTYETAGVAIGFIEVAVDNKSNIKVELIKEEGTPDVYELIDSGVHLSFDQAGSSDDTVLVSGSKFSVPFMRDIVEIGENDTGAVDFPDTSDAFLEGTSATSILTSLRSQIGTSTVITSLIEDIEINQTLLPYSLTFNSQFFGTEANRVFYKLNRTITGTDPQDLLFEDTGELYDTHIAMTSGSDGMTNSDLYLYDINGNALVYIQALSPGSYGNRIKITVRPQPPGQFRLEVEDEVGKNFNVPINPETFILSNYNVNVETGLYEETLDSNLIRAYFVPIQKARGSAVPTSTYNLTPQRLAPPVASVSTVSNPMHVAHQGTTYLTNVYLSGGSQPADYANSDPSETDYLEAVRRLDETDASIISVAGVTVDDARYEQAVTEMVVQADGSTPLNGLRMAVLAAPRGLSQARAQNLVTGISSPRVVVVAGWTTMNGARYLGSNSQPPVGYYCGLLSSIPPHISPSSISRGQSVVGVLSTDGKSSSSWLEAVTRGRIEAMYYDGGLRLFKFLNGLSTANDPYDRYVSVRRMTDQIIMDLYENLQWVRSQPNTRTLRSRIATATDAYLRQLSRDERIYGYQPTICDESNNTVQDMATGKLNIRITFTPVYPADFIRVQAIRDLSTEFSVSAQPGA
jgi:hypothetical protein